MNWKIFFFLALLIFSAYFNSLGHEFISDDIPAIRDNQEINKISYFWNSSYDLNINLRALVIFLTNKIFGLNPIFFRLSNLIFHLGSVWLVFLITSILSAPPIPFLAAGIFAVHPILTEAITWISGGGYPNSAFFALLSLFAYLLSVKTKNNRLLFLSLISFIAALLFDKKLFVLPLVIFAYELSLGNLRKNWPKILPYFLIGGFWALRLFGLIGRRLTDLETIFNQEPGIDNPLIKIPMAISSYLTLIFWPLKLSFYHSELTISTAEYIFRSAITVIFLSIILYCFKKNRFLFFWLSFFLIILLPTLTPFRISWVVAERYVYLASIGIIIPISLLIVKLGEKLKKPKSSYLIFAFLLLALMARTIIRNTDWKNQDALWLATARTSPSSPQNHNNLGDLYARRGDLEKAIEEFKKAIELKPNYADAYHNLANTYQQMGKIELAKEFYQKALNFNPNLWQSHQNLAFIYFSQDKFNEAKTELEKAIKINPQNANFFVNLGIIHLKLGEKENAHQALQKALELDPQNQKAKQLLLTP